VREIFLDGIGLSADGRTFFKGMVRGDLDRPKSTWEFGIDKDIHPYITPKNPPKLKDILVNLDILDKDMNNRSKIG